jgi:uncharacterized protein YjbI with pentapeptide repeats
MTSFFIFHKNYQVYDLKSYHDNFISTLGTVRNSKKGLDYKNSNFTYQGYQDVPKNEIIFSGSYLYFNNSDFSYGIYNQLNSGMFGSQLTNCTCIGTNFSESYMFYFSGCPPTNFSESNFTKTNFTQALFRTNVPKEQRDCNHLESFFSNFSDCNFCQTNFTGADIGKSDFSNSRFPEAQFIDTNGLTDSIFKGVNFSWGQFQGKTSLANNKNLAGLNFTGAQFNSTDFSKADFNNTNFTAAQFIGTPAQGINLSGANFTHSVFNKAQFSNANFTKTNFTSAQMQGVSFTNNLYKTAVFKNTNFTNVNFINANLNGCDFSEALLTGSNFSGQDLRNIKLNKKTLSGVNFMGANLSGVDLSGANLENVNFFGANVTGAKFSKAQLKGANFAGAIIEGQIPLGGSFKCSAELFEEFIFLVTKGQVAGLYTKVPQLENNMDLLIAIINSGTALSSKVINKLQLLAQSLNQKKSDVSNKFLSFLSALLESNTKFNQSVIQEIQDGDTYLKNYFFGDNGPFATVSSKLIKVIEAKNTKQALLYINQFKTMKTKEGSWIQVHVNGQPWNAQDNLFTPGLYYAAWANLTDLVEALVKASVNTNSKYYADAGKIALAIGNAQMVKMLYPKTNMTYYKIGKKMAQSIKVTRGHKLIHYNINIKKLSTSSSNQYEEINNYFGITQKEK